MTHSAVPPAAIRRIAGVVISSELRRLRDDGIVKGSAGARVLHGAGMSLALDSLEAMGVAAALSEAFELDDAAFDTDAASTIDDWADCVQARRIERLTVHTSGSTGVPQTHSHAAADLLEEAGWFAQRFADTQRVVALVPADHLYGLVWTALLPAALGVPVVEGTVVAMPALKANDLIVGVPEHWAALARSRKQWPENVAGVSSGGPLPDAVGKALLATGLARLVDVYGASETSAIGVREVPEVGYALLPRWRLAPGEDPSTLVDREDRRVSLPDHVRWSGERRIDLSGRRDHAVQIGGINVYPDRIAELLGQCEEIADAAVRLGGNGRLKAFVVPAGGYGEAWLERRLRQFVAERLPPAERPTRFRFGLVLPRNLMGKPMDWD